MIDGKLEEITYQIDEFVGDLIQQHQIPPLYLAAICLARLTLVCDEVGSGSDFRLIASEIPPPLQSDAIH